MTLAVRHTTAFKRDYKRLLRRGLPLGKLHAVVARLREGLPLPPANRDHALAGDYTGHRECHIAPDWLLVYKIHANLLILELTRTGTHADLFGN
ncbi:MAG: type II toxin-antitoxin system YafQ family toxin [Kiritimatiellae bacterium]|nr:type II toxin-antitoxin system YafQ family toxin [Kiritimatiellia bacterium]